MMTWNNRIDIAMAVLNALRQPGTDLEHLFAAMESLDGFLLTGASAEVSRAIEKFGLRYNSICASYPPTALETEPPSLNEADTAELIAGVRDLFELIRDAETERLISRLRKHEGKLPEAEIILARRHRDWFVPLLMQECRDEIDKLKQQPENNDRLSADEHSSDEANDEPNDEHSSVPFFALYLFSEWDIAESLPVILEGLSLPDEGPFELFGDSIHEQVPRYLAQFLSRDVDRIDEMICNPRVNMYVRWAVVNSFPYLVRDQNITADAAIARIESNFHKTKVIGNDGRPGYGQCYELSAGIVESHHTLGGSLKSMFGDDDRNWSFFDHSIFRREYSDVQLSDSERQNALLKLPSTRISDCLDCLRHWATFDVPEPKPLQATNSSIRDSVNSSKRPTPTITSYAQSNSTQSLGTTGTIRVTERVPRNAKCPCGSGKKFKQCCNRK